MLTHTGGARTFKHNVQLAGLLSLTAGYVNAAGFLAFAVLTTNVTGHAAIFTKLLYEGDLAAAGWIGLWMLLFLAGAMVSALIVLLIGRQQRYAYVLPLLIEIGILLLVGWLGYKHTQQPGWLAGALLFAMGVQNAMVSMISGHVVRTTHLTGMFTDLGIELSSLVKANTDKRSELMAMIGLRTIIIVSFMAGGLAGGFLYHRLGFGTFYIPAIVLLVTLLFDVSRKQDGLLVKKPTTRH